MPGPDTPNPGPGDRGSWVEPGRPCPWPPSRQAIAEGVEYCLDRAAAGRGQALVLVGAPGIGRTTLLDWASGRGGDRFDVARLRGDVRDASTPGVALDDLERQLGASGRDGGARLPGPSSGDADAGAAELGAFLLDLIDRAPRPVLIVVDDAQWLDPLSLEVLGNLGRRLGGRPVALLLAVRSELGRPPYPPDALGGLPTAVLDRLTDDEAAELLSGPSAGCTGPADGGAGDIVRRAEGNPLAIQVLAAGADPITVAEVHRTRLAGLFRAELAGLSPEALAVAEELAVALDGAAGPLPAGCTDAVRDELESAGLLCRRAGQWRLAHPLLGAALTCRLTPARSRALHARAATAADSTTAATGTQSASVRSLRHRVMAAAGCDDALAADIERVVGDPDADLVAGGRLLLDAALLSTGRADRLRRLLDGAGRLQAAGRLAEAEEHLGTAEALIRTPAERARLTELRVSAEALSASPLAARDALLRLAADTALGDTDGAALRYARAAAISVAIGELELAQSAVSIASRLGCGGATGATVAELVRTLTGNDPDGVEPPAPAGSDPAGSTPAGSSPAGSDADEVIADPAVSAAWATALAGHTPEALTRLEGAVDTARRRSARGQLAGRLVAVAGLRLASGRVVGAVAAAEEALD
ncbi:MAG: ATP-binding protein, partial [Micropruina sp.]|uniref:AAA family ATPase n=1 Tax=Micropruina sp. TaxID=2737536 RepID=UPI0039E60CCF